MNQNTVSLFQPSAFSFQPSWRRVWALVRKEAHQMVRDPSSIAIGVVLPVLLILL
ncbi:MAG TPA: hypothetical protein VN961_03900, partial [Streptosporangiaceae bacterium]|nr:hypothetical protein [Streptosporangiaceae bacterium]